MAEGNIDKLVVEVELSSDQFEKQVENVEDQYDHLKKHINKTSKEVKNNSKKTKKDLSGITKETKDSGKAFEKSGKSVNSFFSPLSKGMLGFAASVAVLKTVVDSVADAAKKYADVNKAARESDLTEPEVRARNNAEERANITPGTFVNAAKQMRNIAANWQRGIIPPQEYLRGLAQAGISPAEIINGKTSDILQRAIANTSGKSSRERNSILTAIRLPEYGNLTRSQLTKNSRDYNASLVTEKKRQVNYSDAANTRDKYIQSQQAFEQAFDDFVLKGLPVLTKVLEALTAVLQKWNEPEVKGGKITQGYGLGGGIQFIKSIANNDKKNKLINHNAENIEKLSNPNNTIINNQTRNTTNNINIHTSDPAKIIRNLNNNGIKAGRLSTNIMSSQ